MEQRARRKHVLIKCFRSCGCVTIVSAPSVHILTTTTGRCSCAIFSLTSHLNSCRLVEVFNCLKSISFLSVFVARKVFCLCSLVWQSHKYLSFVVPLASTLRWRQHPVQHGGRFTSGSTLDISRHARQHSSVRLQPSEKRVSSLSFSTRSSDVFAALQMMGSDGVLYKWLEALESDGIALITNSPQQPGVLELISEKVGYLKRTFYGLAQL